jgi:hypothetical protein
MRFPRAKLKQTVENLMQTELEGAKERQQETNAP